MDKKKHISRITIVTEGTPQVIEQINLQLKKLVPVHKVADFKRGEKDILFRELALFKMLANSKKQDKIRFIRNLNKIGYCVSVKKKSFLIKITKAFQRRYRKQLINGLIDKECLIIAENLSKKV